MKRLSKIAIELNVSAQTLIEICKLIINKEFTPHTKIELNLENQIRGILKGELEWPKYIEVPEDHVASTGDLPEEFLTENSFAEQQLEIIAESDRFSGRALETITSEDLEIETIFSDFEAYSICLGLDNRRSKFIARNYFQKKSSEYERMEAHSLAMATFDKYGGKTLSYIISLPPLPFKAVNATQIFSELDKRRKKQDFPIIRIAFNNENYETQKLQITYYAENRENGRTRNDNVLVVKNKTTGQSLMRVSRSGIVIPERNAKHIIPVMQVFMRFSLDTKKAILNYGLETGECSMCGRELTDSESIRLGIGPICRRSL